MNRRRFTLIVFGTLFVFMILSSAGIIPIPNTTKNIPITQDEIDHFGETLPNGTLHYPDLGFPTRNYFPSAEGTVHEDSILEFAETTPDDVMFYPDSFQECITFGSSGSASITDYGSIAETYAVGGGAWDTTNYDTPAKSFIIMNFTASSQIEEYSYAVKCAGDANDDTAKFWIYDWTIDDWEYTSAVSTGIWQWENGTITDTDLWNGLEVSIKVNATDADAPSTTIIDYAGIQFTVMHLADSNHYAESFADVSDVPYGGKSGVSDGEYSVTTDGDVATFQVDFNDAGNEYVIWTIPVTLTVGHYIEFTFKSSASDVQIILNSKNSTFGSQIQWFSNSYSSLWATKKVLITAPATKLCITVDDKTNDVAATRYGYMDYFRISDSTEMGWQHDGSTTEGTYNSGANWEYTKSSDNDILTLNATYTGTGNSWSWEQLCVDKTSTRARIERDYYPFVGIRWRCTTLTATSVFPVYYFDGYKSDGAVRTSTFGWTTTYFNIKAMSSSFSPSYDGVRFTVLADSSGEQAVIEVNWTKAFSIANFTVTTSGGNINDVAYVSGGSLCYMKGSATYLRVRHDPLVSVTTATYNVWNATLSSGASGFKFREEADNANSFDTGITRGALTSTTLTDFEFYFYSSLEINAIKFWEDATAPTISTFTNTPLDPSMASTVTIETISSDGQGVYTAEATAVVEPSGSSIGTVSMALDYTTQGGAEIWSYAFSAGDLSEGRYTFELEVDDATNQAYEYLTFTVSADTQTIYIRIFDSLGDFVPFETFEVYRNGSRQYTDTFEGNTEYAYQIQVKDRWGESLNTTTFTAGEQELVVTVEVYSLKVMSWHYDFVRFNITRAGLTYSEIVTPLEIVNFRLYTNTYDWAIDYLNGSSVSGDITLTNSTALIVTGNTISDVYGLVTTVNEMTTAINITTTTIQDNTVTIQLMFDWSNTTLYNQSITIIAAFNWENTTLYNQTISIASLFNATNTVLYDQIILIQNMFDWENTTLFNQTISILNAFNATNTVIYTQTISILADISNMNSTIYAQTVQMLLDLENSNSTLYSQTVSLLANIANIDSDIVAQTVTILADIENVNSTIYAQTVQVLTDISNMNSTIYSQTIMILNNLSDLNATVYLVDDPTHLNPLILGYSLSDDYCDLTIVSNWHNASISVYDNDVLRTGPTSELLCPIRYPLSATAGTHNLSIFVDGGNDSFWYNISYTVAEIIAFELEDWDVTPHLGVENYLECIFRTTWENSTIYVYLNDSLQTSVLEQEGGISFSFWMSGNPGLHQYVFNVTSGANIITITWDFYLPDWADTGLVVRWDLWTFQNNYTMITLESNWMNCTFYVYLNSSLVATSYNDPVTLNFTRSMNNGTYNLTIYADGGVSTYTIKNIRYIVTEEGVSYDFSSVTGGRVTIVGDTYLGDTNIIHENPTGMFIDQATAAIVAVGGFLIIFTAFLVAREIRKRDQEKTERMYSQ